MDGAPGGRQAHRADVVGEGDRRGQPQEGHVVVEGVSVVVGVVDDLGHAPHHLVGVEALLALPAQVDGHSAGGEPAETRREAGVAQPGRSPSPTPTPAAGTHPGKQWAALSTHSWLMREPPQEWEL